MKPILALALLGFAISFCSLPKFNRSDNGNNSNNANNANNTNSESSPKDRFIGTWFHAADRETDLLTMTIKRDDTFSLQRDRRTGPARTTSGKYTIRDGRLFPDGELGREVKDGFSLDGDRLKVVVDEGKKTIYFDKK